MLQSIIQNVTIYMWKAYIMENPLSLHIGKLKNNLSTIKHQ